MKKFIFCVLFIILPQIGYAATCINMTSEERSILDERVIQYDKEYLSDLKKTYSYQGVDIELQYNMINCKSKNLIFRLKSESIRGENRAHVRMKIIAQAQNQCEASSIIIDGDYLMCTATNYAK